MIKIINVSKEYTVGTKAVNSLSLNVRPGEIYGFIGPNGAGKSTTIKMITGITDCDQGEIYINNIDISDDIKAKKTICVCSRFSGYVFKT